jgi:hypothetical protein
LLCLGHPLPELLKHLLLALHVDPPDRENVFIREL